MAGAADHQMAMDPDAQRLGGDSHLGGGFGARPASRAASAIRPGYRWARSASALQIGVIQLRGACPVTRLNTREKPAALW